MARDKDVPSLHGIFVNYFRNNPNWLRRRNNDQILAQFAHDHPSRPVDKSVRQAMANVKTRLKKGAKGRRGRKVREAAFHDAVAAARANAKPTKPLGMLEEQIDDCMMLAKQIGKEPMLGVLRSLRHARNEVVIMLNG